MKITHVFLATTMLMGGRAMAQPAWFDLTVRDVGAAESFYSSVLGWQFGGEQGKYTLIKEDRIPIGGVYQQDRPACSGGVSVYFHVSDLAGTLARAKQHGAAVLFGPATAPGGSIMALFQDPDGNHVGLMQ